MHAPASLAILALLATLTQAAPPPAPGDPRAAISPAVIRPPTAEYADAARMFQGIPTLERAPNGRLWAAWYGGGVTEDRHNYIIVATSGDDGRTWRTIMIIDPDRDGPVRAFDPCLWLDPQGALWLFWAQRAEKIPALFGSVNRRPDDADAPWSAPRPFCDGIMMDKPIARADGTWLYPVALWHTDDSARVFASTDDGATLTRIGAASVPRKEDRNCDEHMIVERKDNSLWMLVRTRYGIGESTSTDAGRTWSPVVPSAIPHPTTRFFIRRLASGRLLLVRHDPPGQARVRSHLAAFLSDDDGATWKGRLLLDERLGVSYPDGAQAPDGTIRVIYDYDRKGAKEILMAVFAEDDILQGRAVEPGTSLRVLINRATGANPTHKESAPLSPNTDGQTPALTPRAALEPDAGLDTGTLTPGARLFLDRAYEVFQVPAALQGRNFVRGPITGVRATCRTAGVVHVLTPSQHRNRDSLAQTLENGGYVKVRIPETQLFPGGANVCSVFQKHVKPGEKIDLGKWGVLVY